jgi:hypothetical protein
VLGGLIHGIGNALIQQAATSLRQQVEAAQAEVEHKKRAEKAIDVTFQVRS